ncbi:MAG: hypothetical protein AB1921_13265 [Thermodesulfobacteriota bacterium]
MGEKEKQGKAGKAESRRMTIKYVFPDNLPDLHVTGAWAGITPREEVSLHFYSERRPLPKSVSYRMSPEGESTDEKSEFGGDIIRLMQASLVMNKEAVVQLHEVLESVLEALEEEKEEEE